MLKNKVFLFLMTAGLLFILTEKSWAQSGPRDALDYTEMAKHRTYPSGVDESDLKLQPESVLLRNKKTTVQPEDVGGY